MPLNGIHNTWFHEQIETEHEQLELSYAKVGRTGCLFLCHHFIPVPGRSTTANRATSAGSKATHLLFLRFSS